MSLANARPAGLIGTAQARASGGVLEIALPDFAKDVAVKWRPAI